MVKNPCGEIAAPKPLLFVGLAVILAVGIFASAAQASPIVYIGKDLSASYGSALPGSDAAAAAFQAAIAANGNAVDVIDFESAPLGSFTSLNLGDGVTATFTNQYFASGISNANPSGYSTFDTTRPSGTRYALLIAPSLTTSSLTFALGRDSNAFGAYISGLGTDAPFSYHFDDASGTVVLSTTGGTAFGGSDVQFFGFTDFGTSFNSVRLDIRDNYASGTYGVGIDDVAFSPVPEPGSMALFGTGLVWVARAARRRLRG